MIFRECKLKGAYLIEPERISDSRGYFARTFCKEELKEYGLVNEYVQCNVSYNLKKNTLRGMHFQTHPFEECKIVSCVKGAVYDVIVDLRKSSESYCQWESFTLTEENKHQLYIPKGFAHGYQTLEDNTEVYYQMSQFYHGDYSYGVRWDDWIFKIEWPDCKERMISLKDKNWPDYCEQVKFASIKI